MIFNRGKKLKVICSLVILLAIVVMPLAGIGDSSAQAAETHQRVSNSPLKTFTTPIVDELGDWFDWESAEPIEGADYVDIVTAGVTQVKSDLMFTMELNGNIAYDTFIPGVSELESFFALCPLPGFEEWPWYFPAYDGLDCLPNAFPILAYQDGSWRFGIDYWKEGEMRTIALPESNLQVEENTITLRVPAEELGYPPSFSWIAGTYVDGVADIAPNEGAAFFEFIPYVTRATLATNGGPPIYDFELRIMLNKFIPTSNAHSTLIVFTECYGGDKMSEFEGRKGTTVLSATSVCETATYGGYDNDAARELKPGLGRTSDNVHNAGVAGKADSETPQKQGPGASLEPTDPAGKIKSRHVLVYAGQPDAKPGRDNDQRDTIEGNFAGQIGTTVTTVGGDGTSGWDYPGTMEGLRNALDAIGKKMNSNQQFIFFVTDHGDKHSCKTGVTISPYTELYVDIPPETYNDMIFDPSNQPNLSIFTSGPQEIPLEYISVNDISFYEYAEYGLDYNGNGIIDEDEGYEYIFPINEEILMIEGNHIEIFSYNEYPIISPLISLGSGAIAKLEGIPFDPWIYDENGDGEIQKSEAIKAVQDYFDGTITKEQTIEVVLLYFG